MKAALSRCWSLARRVLKLPKLTKIVRLAWNTLLRPGRADNWLYWARFCERYNKPGLAERLYKRMVRLAPHRSIFRAYLATFYIEHQRLAEAEKCLEAAIADCGPRAEDRLKTELQTELGEIQVALALLGIAKFDAGSPNEAHKHWEQAIALNPEHLRTYYEIWVALVSRGHFDLGDEYYQRHRKMQDLLRRRLKGAIEPARYLTFMWSYQIGHLALLDGYFKLARLGWRSDEPAVLLAAREHISNPFFLNMWRPFLKVVSEPSEMARLEESARVQEDYLPVYDVRDKGRWLNIACALAQQEWEKQARPGLLELDAETDERGWQVLEKLGIPRGAWFVGLHVRDSGYHRNRDDSTHSFRNADLTSYLPAIEAIVRRGGWVLRMGDPLKRSMPATNGLVDYANSGRRTDWMDIFLCARSRFFLGTQSGLSYVPNVFGVPTVMTNYISLGIPPWYGNDLFIPKLLFSKKKNRLLSFAEILESKLGFTQNIGDFARHDIAWIDNTANEIREVVEEMMERLDNRPALDQDGLQNEWARLARAHAVVVNSRMGAAFLARHRQLLEDSVGRPLAA